MAFVVANSMLLKELKKPAPKKELLKRSVEKVSFKLDDKILIKRSADGEEFITAVLATDDVNLDGKKFSPELLKSWADSINSGNTLVGDVDHQMWDRVVAENLDPNTVKAIMKDKKGIAKAVKAVYEKGKLFVRLVFDKRYRRQIMNSKGLSLEAYVDTREDGLVEGGDLFGFTFGVNTPMAVPNTGVLA